MASTWGFGRISYSIIAVESSFFGKIEQKVLSGEFYKIETSSSTESEQVCAKNAWTIAKEKEANGLIKRSYTEDFESSVPKEYTKDGKAHCYLYLGIKTMEKI